VAAEPGCTDLQRDWVPKIFVLGVMVLSTGNSARKQGVADKAASCTEARKQGVALVSGGASDSEEESEVQEARRRSFEEPDVATRLASTAGASSTGGGACVGSSGSVLSTRLGTKFSGEALCESAYVQELEEEQPKLCSSGQGEVLLQQAPEQQLQAFQQGEVQPLRQGEVEQQQPLHLPPQQHQQQQQWGLFFLGGEERKEREDERRERKEESGDDAQLGQGQTRISCDSDEARALDMIVLQCPVCLYASCDLLHLHCCKCASIGCQRCLQLYEGGLHMCRTCCVTFGSSESLDVTTPFLELDSSEDITSDARPLSFVGAVSNQSNSPQGEPGATEAGTNVWLEGFVTLYPVGLEEETDPADNGNDDEDEQASNDEEDNKDDSEVPDEDQDEAEDTEDASDHD